MRKCKYNYQVRNLGRPTEMVEERKIIARFIDGMCGSYWQSISFEVGAIMPTSSIILAVNCKWKRL